MYLLEKGHSNLECLLFTDALVGKKGYRSKTIIQDACIHKGYVLLGKTQKNSDSECY